MTDALIETPPDHRSGAVVLVGRPNVGKSTLFNALVGERLAIVTAKPQTTRNMILGILTTPTSQMLIRDTPGLLDPRYRLQEFMRRQIDRALEDADTLLGVVDLTDLSGTFDPPVVEVFKAVRAQRVIILNKADRVSPQDVEAAVRRTSEAFETDSVMAASALTGANLPELQAKLAASLPFGPRFYPEDTLTEQPERFYVAELIREQIFLQLRQEIPYSIAVTVDEFLEDRPKVYVGATIVVERDSQKGIVIGSGGKTLKSIGRNARQQIETFIDRPVYLDLRVKVYENWRKKDSMLKGLGYGI